MFLCSGFDIVIVSILTPGGQGLVIANALYAPMTFTAVLGILLFTMFLTEKKEEALTEIKNDISTNIDITDAHTERIIELSRELQEYKNKLDELEQKIKENEK